MRNKLYFPVLLLAITIVSCKHEIPQPALSNDNGIGGGGGTGGGGGGGGGNYIPCDSNVVYFSQEIQPLLVSYCGMANSTCHIPGTDAGDKMIVATYADLMASGEVNGSLNNDFWAAITEPDPTEDDKMPPITSPQLSQAQINLIQLWLQQGAQDLHCDDCDSINVTFNADIKPIIDNSCKGCHSPGGSAASIPLTNHGELTVVVFNNKLMPALYRTGLKPMPPTYALNSCDLAKIQRWVNDGALNN